MKKLSVVLLAVFLLGLLIVGGTQVFGSPGPGSTSPTVVLSQSVVPWTPSHRVLSWARDMSRDRR